MNYCSREIIEMGAIPHDIPHATIIRNRVKDASNYSTAFM